MTIANERFGVTSEGNGTETVFKVGNRLNRDFFLSHHKGLM